MVGPTGRAAVFARLVTALTIRIENSEDGAPAWTGGDGGGASPSGKSTWIRQTLSHCIESLLLLAAEEPRIRELASSPALALDALRDVLQPSSATRSSVASGRAPVARTKAPYGRTASSAS